MSDHIPFDIQEEIIKRLPIKSLVQFRSVSTAWKSLIDSSQFVTNYHHSQTHQYVSIVDDDTFPQLKFSRSIPLSVTLLKYPRVLGSSQGLVCFYGSDALVDSRTSKVEQNIAVIWNPTIRISVSVSVPDLRFSYNTVVGFGVTPDTCDPKLVKVSFGNYKGYTEVDVFTLSTKAWKRLTTNLPCNSIAFEDNQVCIDRFIYWCAYYLDCEEYSTRFHEYEVIMSFDMITEEFKKLDVPDSLDEGDQHLFISKVRESLVVVQMVLYYDTIEAVSVWMMEHGDPKSLTKKFTINTPNDVHPVCGLRKSGQPLIEMTEDNVAHELDEVFVLDEHFGNIGITPMKYSCKVNSCIETLLLLDHSDSSYFDMNRGKDNVNITNFGFWKRRLLEHASKVWRLMFTYSAN